MALAWTALLLAETGLFVGWIPPAIGAFVFLAVVLRVRPRPRRNPGSKAQALVAAAIAAGVLAASVPPGEAIRGGWDPGVYLHTAAGIVRHRTLNFPAGDLAELSPFERTVVSRDLNGIVQPYPGMFLLPDGRFSPQFQHLYPALLAVAMALGGIWGALLVNPLLAVAAVAAIYALARRVVPAPWAPAAPLVLALNPALLWQAKFPTSELLAQLLLVGGAVFLIDALDEPQPKALPALLAGASFGMAFLARYDTVLVLAPLVVILALQAAQPERRRTVALVLAPIAVLVAHALAHTRYLAPYYVPLRGVVGPALGVAAAALLLALGARLSHPGRRAWAAVAARATLLRRLAAAALAVWAALAWAVRPHLSSAGGAPDGTGLDALLKFVAGPGRDDFLYLVDILGAPGLVIALAGLALALWRAGTPGSVACLLPATGVLVVFGTNVFHDHTLMWVLRRFVPAALPLLAVCVAVAAAGAASLFGRFGRNAVIAAGAAVLVLALAPNLGATRAAAAQREWPGLVRWFDGVAQAVPTDASIFTDLTGFGAPLRFLYSRKSYEYNRLDGSRKSLFFRVVRRRVARGETVYLLTRPAVSGARGLVFREAGSFPLRSSVPGSARHGVPRASSPRNADVFLYRVELAAARPETGAATPGEDP